jgi:hypothetical protein
MNQPPADGSPDGLRVGHPMFAHVIAHISPALAAGGELPGFGPVRGIFGGLMPIFGFPFGEDPPKISLHSNHGVMSALS